MKLGIGENKISASSRRKQNTLAFGYIMKTIERKDKHIWQKYK